MIGAILFAAAIKLINVTGDDIYARAFFDANNVKVGDPMILTVDFLGNADFAELHPPSLAKSVDRRDWKIDDTSAKTDTYRDARRLTYRVRPMREGLIYFPALTFSYESSMGEGTIEVSANAIPVHVKPGEQVAAMEVSEGFITRSQPDELITDPGVELSDENAFAWRKACASPTADAFKPFRFPAAKLNEARCAILESNWARALRIYSRLEWITGQTPAIERGICAALALKDDSLSAELPMWRQIMRPILKFSWQGRIAIVGGTLACLFLLLLLIRRGIHAIASLVIILAFSLPFSGFAQLDIFDQMEEMMQQHRQQLQHMSSSMSFSFGGEAQSTPDVKASVRIDSDDLQVGKPFAFILALEAPKNFSIGQVRLIPNDMYGMKILGNSENLTDGISTNPSNVVKRISVPVRYDVPYRGKISFRVDGMISGKVQRKSGGSHFTSMFSNNFRADTKSIDIDIKPLPEAGQPKDFSGIIADKAVFTEKTDLTTIETNDVIQITYRLEYSGHVPHRWMPPGSTFEIGHEDTREGGIIEWRRFFVADGAINTPQTEFSYYDPNAKIYKRVRTRGEKLEYR